MTYVYDTAPNGKGHPASITTVANSVPVITKAFEYDLLGHVTKETRTINATPYITQTEYDLAGNPKRVIYPDSAHTEELSFYNNAGQLEKVQKKQGTTTADLVTNFDYAETGAPKTIAYANGVTTTNTYDITYLYYLTHKVTAKGVTKLQDISYAFDPTGNISQITDASQTDAAKTVAYTYDGLSRLLTATATNAANGQDYAQTFAYDILGNITNKSDVGAYTYAQTNYASPQAVTAAGGKTYSYDNNGNLTGDGTWTHTWDYKDRLLSSTKTGAAVTYSYDEGGTRVTKKNTTSGKTTIYVDDLLDIEAGTEKLSFYARDLKLATLENTPTPTLAYTHTDHLSGASVDTDATGNVLQLTDYYPYGDSRIESTTTAFHNDYTFTGKERDEDTTLLYYEARYYDSHLGRFISLDPVFGDINDPQSFNKYAYVRNNPLKYVDPEGKMFFAVPNEEFVTQNPSYTSDDTWNTSHSGGDDIRNYAPVTGQVDALSIIITGKGYWDNQSYSGASRWVVGALSLIPGGKGPAKVERASEEVIEDAVRLRKQFGNKNSITIKTGENTTERFDFQARSGGPADMTHYDKDSKTLFIGPHVQTYQTTFHTNPKTGEVFKQEEQIGIRSMTKDDVNSLNQCTMGDANASKKP